MFDDDRKIRILDDPEFPSGPWVGFYLQRGVKSSQDLLLRFLDGNLTGSGRDVVGSFTIRGRYDVDSKEVIWRKKYLGSHTVFYRGFREIKGIWGIWEIPPFDSGGFHIWPECEDGELLARAAVTEKTRVDILRASTPKMRIERLGDL